MDTLLEDIEPDMVPNMEPFEEERAEPIKKMDLKGRITIYSIAGCPHCLRAKSQLQELHLPYTDISLDTYPHLKDELRRNAGSSSVPQVYFNNVHIGGATDLENLVKDKERFEIIFTDVKNHSCPIDGPAIPDPKSAVKDIPCLNFVCEPDEYAQLVQDLKHSGIIKSNRAGILFSEKNSFSGTDFVRWVKKTKGLDEEEAVDLGQKLIDKHFGHQLKDEVVFTADDTLYRLLEHDTVSALNTGELTCQPLPASKIGEDLRRLILRIYSLHLSADGKTVDYEGIEASEEYQEYITLTKNLVRTQVSKLTAEDKIAFFINIYNALVIHAGIVMGKPTTLWQRYKFFNTARYVIGGQVYSLQDIENGVLRGNRAGIGNLFPPFGRGDPRRKIALPRVQPLIHFALVCGAKSCPPIKTYLGAGIHDQLRLAAESFFEGEDAISINVKTREIHLSMIFRWYKVDFGRRDQEKGIVSALSVIRFIHEHMQDGEKRDQLEKLLETGRLRIKYLPYDWGSNSKDRKEPLPISNEEPRETTSICQIN